MLEWLQFKAMKLLPRGFKAQGSGLSRVTEVEDRRVQRIRRVPAAGRGVYL